MAHRARAGAGLRRCTAGAGRQERLREDLRLLYVALTRPRHALWMGWAMKRGNSNCANEQGAAGYLLAGDVSQCRRLARQHPGPELHADRRGGSAGRTARAHALCCRAGLPALAAAPVYEAQFDRRWGIGSFSSLTRAMAAPSLPVLPVAAQSPAEDERATAGGR
jgi:exodeoxyribonuclease V beta subunit